MSSPAAPSPRRVEDVPGQLPADLRLGVMHRRDLLQGDEQLDGDTNGHQADDQPRQWFGETDEYPAVNAAASQNAGSHPRASRRTHADGQAHNAPQQEDDEEFENLDFPVQERARRAHFTHLRHYLGAHAAGAAVRFVHGREAGRQTHDQVWADGEAARAEADANVGAWRRALAAGFAGLLATAGEIRADLSVRFRENQRIAALEHAAQIRRNAGERVVVDPVEYIRADRAVREAREARRAAAQPAHPGRPARMAQPVRRAQHVPRRYGPELPEESEDDQVSGVIDHLYHGEYQLPRFGSPDSPRREEYIAEPEPGQRRAPSEQADEAQPEPQRAAQRDQAGEAQPQHTQTDTRHGNAGRFYEPSYEWLEKATERYEQYHPLGMPERVSAEDRMQWIRNAALYAEHEAELNVYRLPKYLNPTLPLGPEAPETVAARKREQQLGGELDALYEEGTVEVPVRNRVGPNDSTRRRIQGIFELARGRGIVYSPNDENVLLRLFRAHANDEDWSEADTMTILAKLAARQQRQQ